MTTITLNETERRICLQLAQERMKYDRGVGARATIYNGTEAHKNELDSIGAEIAFCKLHNCYPDLDPTHFLPHDATLPDGRTVDIKQTRYESGRLLVKVKERAKLPDLYALMVGEFPSYRFAGMVSARDLIRREHIASDIPYPAYAMGQEGLSVTL